MLNGWINPPGQPGANGWQLRAGDRFLPADLDGDGQEELIVVSPDGQWVGVVEQQAGALVLTSILNGWINPPGQPGANGWQLRAGDRFLPADLDGDNQAELIVVSPDGQWVGVVEQQAGALVLTSLLNGWINPPGLPGANGWQLRAGDRFIPADLDGDNQAELIVVSPDGQWVGVVEQQAGALVLTSLLNGWINPPGQPGANGWQLRAGDRFLAADLDGDGQAELIVVSPDGQWVGVVEQQAGALVLTTIDNQTIKIPSLVAVESNFAVNKKFRISHQQHNTGRVCRV